MKRLDKFAGCAVATVLVVLFSVSGDAYAAGGKNWGDPCNGRAGWDENPKEPKYTRLDSDPSDIPYQQPAVVDGVPAKQQLRVVGGPTPEE